MPLLAVEAALLCIEQPRKVGLPLRLVVLAALFPEDRSPHRIELVLAGLMQNTDS